MLKKFTDAATSAIETVATPGSIGILNGKHLHSDKSNLDLDVFFVPVNNPETAIKYLLVVVLFILLCSFISCRTTVKNTSQVAISKAENNVLTQEFSTDHQQLHTSNFNEVKTSLYIDSTTETIVIAFKLLNAGDSVKQTIPVQAEGRAIITRNKKVISTVRNLSQQAKVVGQRDSSMIKTADTKSAQSQSVCLQPVRASNRLKSFLTVMMVLLFLWIYYVFRLKR